MNKITNVRINFLLALKKHLGNNQPNTISRVDLQKFVSSWSPGQKGPLNMPLKAPSWLTNTKQYTVNRGEYRIPWEILDQYNAIGQSTTTTPSTNTTPTTTTV